MANSDSTSSGYIYFVEAANLGLIKIGWAKDVLGRIRTLSTGCPVQLELRAIAEGSPKDERDCHRRFKHLRRKGEWFDDDPLLRAEMAKYAMSQPVYFSADSIKPTGYRDIIYEDFVAPEVA